MESGDTNFPHEPKAAARASVLASSSAFLALSLDIGENDQSILGLRLDHFSEAKLETFLYIAATLAFVNFILVISKRLWGNPEAFSNSKRHRDEAQLIFEDSSLAIQKMEQYSVNLAVALDGLDRAVEKFSDENASFGVGVSRALASVRSELDCLPDARANIAALLEEIGRYQSGRANSGANGVPGATKASDSDDRFVSQLLGGLAKYRSLDDVLRDLKEELRIHGPVQLNQKAVSFFKEEFSQLEAMRAEAKETLENLAPRLSAVATELKKVRVTARLMLIGDARELMFVVALPFLLFAVCTTLFSCDEARAALENWNGCFSSSCTKLNYQLLNPLRTWGG